VLFAARRFPPDVFSGSETVFRGWWEDARATGVDVSLVVGFVGSAVGVPVGAMAVDLRGVPAGLAHARMARAVERQARAYAPDVVLSNSVECVPTGVPVVLVVHDLNFGALPRGASAEWARRAVYRVQCGRAAAVIVPSEATRARLVDVGVVASKVHVVPNGIDLARWTPAPSRSTESVTRFAYPARIFPGKGQHAAIDALGRMRPDQRARAHLTIAGATVDRIYLDQLRVQAYRLPVAFHTDVPDLLPYYRAADVVVFPTLVEEGFGLTALEAMACGKPVIYYDQPAIREATGGHAEAVPRDDAASLRDAMLRLMADPAERERRGRVGRAWAETRARSAAWAGVYAVLRRASGR
jgi:glycosyltransferase involved in cell wall biosynthesis